MTAFITYILGFRPRYSLIILLVLTASTVIEAMGLMTIMPLLNLLSVSGGTANVQEIQLGGLAKQFLMVLPSSSLKLITLVIALVLFRVLLGVSFSILHNRLKHEFLKNHRQKVFSDVANATRSYHLSQNISGFVHASTQVVEGLSEGLSSFYRLVAALIMALIGIGVSILISPFLTALFLLFAGILSLPLIRFDRKALSLSHKNLDLMSVIYAQLESYFGGLKTIKTLGSMDAVDRHYSKAANDHADVSEAFIKNGIIVNGLTRLIAALSFLLIILVSLALETGFWEPVAIVIVFSRVLPNLQAVHNSVRQLMSNLPDFEAFRRLSNSATAEVEQISGPDIMFGEASTLNFHNVVFSYSQDTKKTVLSDISTVIKATNLIGIIGPNGAGKTTFVDIVAGLLNPTSGQVTVDDVIISPSSAASWRKNISYVTQEEYLFTGTIRENFILVRDDMSDEEILGYIETATAKDFILSFAHGLDTEIGEKGTRLSRGQRQKICLARALAKDAPIIILDEATSAMSPMDERKILRSLQSYTPKKTILIISHRLASLRNLERYLVLEDGKIQEFDGASGLEQSTNQYVKELLASD